MQKTSMHPDAIGNGSLAQTFVQSLNSTLATASLAKKMMAITYSPEPYPGSAPDVNPQVGAITVTGSAGANTATIALIVESSDVDGSANADTTFTITVAAAKVAWAAGAASAYTLKDVIDLINEDDAGGTDGKLLQGFKAWALDAPYDFQINAASALASVAETPIKNPGGVAAYTECLTRDENVHVVDSDYILYKRIGFPEVRDRGLFKFVDLWGAVTGTTNGSLKIYRDDVADFVEPTGTYATDIANHEVLFSIAPASISTSRGTTPGVPSMTSFPETWRGPVIVEVKSDDISVSALNIAMQAVV